MESRKKNKKAASKKSKTKAKERAECKIDKTATVEEQKAEDAEDESLWWTIPHLILVKILSHLSAKDVTSVAATCRRWYMVANDDIMWKYRFQRHFKINPSIPLKSGASLWKNEYIRLTTRIPFFETQCMNAHSDQALHVSFSHNGKMFATCSKDCSIIIWNSGHPCTKKCSHNLKKFNWFYTQFSQFNQSDTLLLVSGVEIGSPRSTSGEIAVFTVSDKGGSQLRCRILNRPFDVFGTWLSDQYLISGDLHWLPNLASTTVLWLNNVNRDVSLESNMNPLYKFYNCNANTLRSIMIAKCPWLNSTNDPLAKHNLRNNSDEENSDEDNQQDGANKDTVKKFPSHITTSQDSLSSSRPRQSLDDSLPSTSSGRSTVQNDDISTQLAEKFRRLFSGDMRPDNLGIKTATGAKTIKNTEPHDDMNNSIAKYLIFFTGNKTFKPHQIGIKRIRQVTYPKTQQPRRSLKERIAAKKAGRLNQLRQPDPLWRITDPTPYRFDTVDKIIELHGHIIGMALSPDHRYLYVNTRPWPKDFVITDVMESPPIAEEIYIHIIDLMTLKLLGYTLHGHKAFTPTLECYFIFLDVCDNYVASGAEDNQGYLWDRYYHVPLAKYKHNDVVNSVAFNPKDPEMLVTTSDDSTIKIWRSRSKVKELNIDTTNMEKAFDVNDSD